MAKKNQNTSVRAIVFPIKWPTSKDDQETLRKVLKSGYQAATEVSQHAIRQILAADNYVRSQADTKLPKCPEFNLYRKAEPTWDGWSSSANCIVQNIRNKWFKIRYDVLWTNKMGIPSYRYPQPYPFHNQTWKIVECSDRLVVQVTMVGVRFDLELSVRGNRRGLECARRIAAGDYKQGEASIYESRGGHSFKMTAHIPDRDKKVTGGVLRVRSDVNAFMLAENEHANRLWIHNAVQMREWIAKHTAACQRYREDLKANRRLRTSDRKALLESWQGKQRKHHDRINSFVEETTTAVVKYAVGSGFAGLELDCSDKSFMPSFPWFRFVERIKHKAKASGMELNVVAGKQDENESSVEVIAEGPNGGEQ
jgi:hypothetical protein